MKTTLFMAMSVNGLIATPDGQEDFLSDQNWDDGYGFDDFTDITKIVVSHDPTFVVKDGYTLANSPQQAIGILTKAGFTQALVAGGSTLNAACLNEQIIDEIILNVEPVLVGQGIPLCAPNSMDTSQELATELELMKCQVGENDIIRLQYQVLK